MPDWWWVLYWVRILRNVGKWKFKVFLKGTPTERRWIRRSLSHGESDVSITWYRDRKQFRLIYKLQQLYALIKSLRNGEYCWRRNGRECPVICELLPTALCPNVIHSLHCSCCQRPYIALHCFVIQQDLYHGRISTNISGLKRNLNVIWIKNKQVLLTPEGEKNSAPVGLRDKFS